MPITLTQAFNDQKLALGSEPIWTCEIIGSAIFFATREPQFTGTWIAGDGLIAGSGIEANDSYPTYDTGLVRLDSGGIGSVEMAIDAFGLARTGNTQVQILNQELFSGITSSKDLTGSIVRIRLGFFGQDFQDYVTLFQGVIEDIDATYESTNLEIIDDTLFHQVPVPPQTGSDFFPNSVTVGRAVPIVLGDVELHPAYELISDVTAILLVPMGTTDTELVVDDPGALFPSSGTVLLTSPTASETVSYSGVTNVIIGQAQGQQLQNLVRTVPVVIDAGATVVLTSFKETYLSSFAPERTRKVRLPGGTHPTGVVALKTIPAEPNGGDPRQVQIIELDTAQPGLTSTVAGMGRGVNLIVNGEGNAPPAPPDWLTIAGSWVAGTPPGESEPTISGTSLIAQGTQSELTQDFTTIIGNPYRLVFTMRLDSSTPPPFASVRLGESGAPANIFDFGSFTGTTEQGFDLIFNAKATTTRITLLVDNNGGVGGPFTAYFDHLECYDLKTENPARQMETLIKGHLPQIQVDEASFTVAEAEWQLVNDRMAGVLDQTQEAQELLGRLAGQFRAKTWLNENGKQKIKVFNNAEPEVRRIDPSIVDKGSFRIGFEPEEKVYTNFYVYFDRRSDISPGSGLGTRDGYQAVMFANSQDTNSVEDAALPFLCERAESLLKSTRTLEVFADMVPGVASADRLLSHIVRQHTHQKLLASFTTWINMVELEIADIVRINHPLLPDAQQGVTFEVYNKEIHPNGFMVSYSCAEIRQSQFNAFIETWDPPAFLNASTIKEETWAPAVNLTLGLAIFGPDGFVNECNPFIETWDAFVALVDEDLTTWDSSDDFGFTPIDLSTGLSSAFNIDFTVSPPTVFGDLQDPQPDNTQPTASNKLLDQSIPSPFNNHMPCLGFRNVENTVNQYTYLPTGGPGGAFPAVEYRNDGVEISQYAAGGNENFSMAGDWAINIWCYIRSKASGNHQPILINQERDEITFDFTTSGGLLLPGTDATTQSYMLYYDHLTDRMVFAISNFLGAATLDVHGDAWIASLGNKTTASTFGSPPLSTWFMVTITGDTATDEIGIGVNDGTIDTTAHVGLIHPTLFFGAGGVQTIGSPTAPIRSGLNAGPVSGGGTVIGGSTSHQMDGLPSKKLGLDGRIALLAFWGRKLEAADITKLYAAGAGLSYPYPV